MKEKSGFEKNVKVLLIVLTILFVISALSVILPYILYWIGCVFLIDNLIVLQPSVSTDYNVFISFLSLAFCIAIATPYFISKKTISKKLEEYTRNEYKIELLSNAENVERADAHVSRMIAFNLLEEGYYFWAIGWGFRALKRYLKLNKIYTGIYDEFSRFIFKEIILKALTEAEEKIDKAEIRFKKDSQETFKSEAYRIKLRAVKDYVDFKFWQQKHKNNKLNLDDCINEIDKKMKIVFFDLYRNISSENTIDYKKNVDGEIFKLSSFKEDSVEYRSFFYQRIWNSVFSEKEIEDKLLSNYKDEILKRFLK